ncbi:MAG: hypothetical protein WBC18_07830 [Ottowia sp.]|uniref:hypothetical protein n=1 Tax=Ottowia sp. TaxID=1898956 RepID=UPI003C7309DD
MYYIDPRQVTDSTLLFSSLAEDPSAAWTAGTYAVGDERHVVATHRVYKCAVAGSSTVSPELDPTTWFDDRPTNKWAPFDIYTKLTKAVSTTDDIVYEVLSRYATALVLDGLEGNAVLIEVLDHTGGSVVFRYPQAGTRILIDPARGYWDYAFSQRRRTISLLVTGLPMLSSGVIRITVSAPAGERRAIGLISRGPLRQVHGTEFGGVAPGANASPITYTYRPRRDDGTFGPTVLRPGAKQRSWIVRMDRAHADDAVRIMDQLSNQPAYVMATLEPGFDGLRGFGLVTRGEVSYDAISTCNVSIEDIV